MTNRGNFLKSVFGFLVAPTVAPAVIKALPLPHTDVTFIPADNPSKLRLGWIVYETVGIAIINPKGIAKITVN